MKRKLSKKDIETIVRLHDAGTSFGKLASMFGVSRQVIQYNYKKYKERHTKQNKTIHPFLDHPDDNIKQVFEKDLDQWKRISGMVDQIMQEIERTGLNVNDPDTVESYRKLVQMKAQATKHIEHLQYNLLPLLNLEPIEPIDTEEPSSNILEQLKSSLAFLEKSILLFQAELIRLTKLSETNPILEKRFHKRIDSLIRLLREYREQKYKYLNFLQKEHHIHAFEIWKKIILKTIQTLEQQGYEIKDVFLQALKETYEVYTINPSIIESVIQDVYTTFLETSHEIEKDH